MSSAMVLVIFLLVFGAAVAGVLIYRNNRKKVDSAVAQAKESIGDVIESVDEAVDSAVDTISETAEDVAEKIKSKVKDIKVKK